MDPTAAPVDLVIHGQTYKAYPFRDRDHEEYNKWVRREYIRRCKEILGDDSETLKIALLEATSMAWSFGSGRQIALTVAGIAKMANLLTRTNKFTEHEMANTEAIRATIDAFAFLHGIINSIDSEEDPAPESEPTEKPSGN